MTANVIDIKAETPGLDAMLKKFSSEHWHDEDEVRLIVEGRGIFHIHPTSGPVFALEVEAGDLIRVPRAAPITGSISAATNAYARFGFFKISLAGRRTIPRVASIRNSSRCVSVHRICPRCGSRRQCPCDRERANV